MIQVAYGWKDLFLKITIPLPFGHICLLDTKTNILENIFVKIKVSVNPKRQLKRIEAWYQSLHSKKTMAIIAPK